MEAVIVQVVAAGGILAALVVIWGLRSSIRPSIIERLERSMVSNQTRLDTQEGEIDDLRRQIVELRETAARDGMKPVSQWAASTTARAASTGTMAYQYGSARRKVDRGCSSNATASRRRTCAGRR